MKKIFIAASCILATAGSLCAQTTVHYVELKEGQAISAQPIKTIVQTDELPKTGKGQEIVVYPAIELQTLEGVGGAFNEIGGEALMSLNKEARTEVMRNIFSKEGAGFAYCRTAIGASDFGIDAYSYSEVAEDYKMEHFSIERERTSVIPYIQLAYKINPSMKLFASPWSPPGWMKASGFMDKGTEDPSKNHLKDEAKIYRAYALYFSKYVQAYAKEGIDIDRIVVQNESDFHTKYPSCLMPPAQMAKFVKGYLRPQFEKEDIDTEIWAGTFRSATANVFSTEFAANPDYLDCVDGIGIQYTKPIHICDMNKLSNNKPTMHTEGVCYNGLNSTEQAFKRLEEVSSYINYGVNNHCYWNMILNETSKSGWDWKQNSMIVIDRTKKTVTYNPDYAVMVLFSKFMQPGSKRVASHCRETVMSVKQKGKMHLFVVNPTKKVQWYTCTEKGKPVAFAKVPAESMAVIAY